MNLHLLRPRELELHRAWFNPDLTDDDREWLRRNLKLAEVEPPEVDLSWITVEGVPLW